MKKMSKILSLLLVMSLMLSFSIGVTVSAEDVATSIVLNTTVRDQRPDNHMFESISAGLIQNMVNATLGSDSTPVLNGSGWYKADISGDDVSTAVQDTSKDYSTDSQYGFNSADFYRWYHDCSQDPIADIISVTKSIASASSDPNEKLMAVCYAAYAIEMAKSEYMDDYDTVTEMDGQKVYIATEIAIWVNDILSTLQQAKDGKVDIVEAADDEIYAVYEELYALFADVDVNAVLPDLIDSLDTSECKNVALNMRIDQQLVLEKEGDLKTFADGTQGYIYTFDSAVTPIGSTANSDTGYFPIDNQGFGNFSGSGVDPSNNYHFTMTFQNNFLYHGGETFTFAGDDDVWVFINDKLVLDIGGVHGPITGSVNLDAVAEQQGFKVGDVCKMDFFFAERMTKGSNLKISTSIQFIPVDYVPTTTQAPVQTTTQPVPNPPTGVNGMASAMVVAAIAMGSLIALNVSAKKRNHK